MFKLKQKVFNLIIILIIGGLGGVIADYFVLPYLANFSAFAKIEFIQRSKSATTIINKTDKITITENVAIEEAVHKINSCLVAVQFYQNNKLVKQGSGIIATNDGLIITAADLISQKKGQYLVVFSDGSSLESELVRINKKHNLAILKIQADNLPVVSFANINELRLGQRIILIGAQIIDDDFYRFVNVGTVRGINAEILSINLEEKNSSANGGPLLNIAGEVIGLNIINENGLIKAIPCDIIIDIL